MRQNRVKQILSLGGIPIGHWVGEFKTPGIAKLLEAAGFDFVVYDMEHSGFSIDNVADLLAWTKATPLTPIVRPPAVEYHLISRALDVGAQGILVPRVETLDEVRRTVEAVKYPPEGKRGIGFEIAHDDFMPGDVMEKMRSANAETMVIVLIENVSALEHVDEFLAVPGVDIGWVGHFDLTASMGIPGQFEHPRFLEAIDRVIAACRRTGKAAGILPSSVTQALSWVEQGFRCIAYGRDASVWLDSCRRAVGDLREELSRLQSRTRSAG